MVDAMRFLISLLDSEWCTPTSMNHPSPTAEIIESENFSFMFDGSETGIRLGACRSDNDAYVVYEDIRIVTINPHIQKMKAEEMTN